MLHIDHVTIAGPDLKALDQGIIDLGLQPQYGGPHSNGVTHMSLLGFTDGSYIELYSTMQPGQASPTWGEAVAGNAGPCAWAVAANDIQAETRRLAAAGIPVAGPSAMYRQRPDGRRVEWELTFPGKQPAGSVLPFIIQDTTPREWRVVPTPGLTEKGLRGVARVVIGVQALDPAIALFRQAYGWSQPTLQDDPNFGAKLAHFADTPVILATPPQTDESNWLSARLARFGDLPCAFLLKTPDFAAAQSTFRLGFTGNWFGKQVGWIDPNRLQGTHLGICQD